jgi:hypothetical protein
MSIDDDWMVGLMIIYIEKTVAKTLDMNNIIKENGDVSSMSPNPSISSNLSINIKFDYLLRF